MAQVRVDYAALASVAERMRAVPDRFGESHQALASVRGMTPSLGDATAVATGDELLRQLGWFMEMAAVSGAGMTRALLAAAGDYEAAEQVVIRFDGA